MKQRKKNCESRKDSPANLVKNIFKTEATRKPESLPLAIRNKNKKVRFSDEVKSNPEIEL